MTLRLQRVLFLFNPKQTVAILTNNNHRLDHYYDTTNVRYYIIYYVYINTT